jgi:hypothetical protein
VQEVNFPAVTLCNPRGHDTGEYVRAIFNNFAFLEKNNTRLANGSKGGKSAKLKEIFQPFLDHTSTSAFGEYTFFRWAM